MTDDGGWWWSTLWFAGAGVGSIAFRPGAVRVQWRETRKDCGGARGHRRHSWDSQLFMFSSSITSSFARSQVTLLNAVNKLCALKLRDFPETLFFTLREVQFKRFCSPTPVVVSVCRCYWILFKQVSLPNPSGWSPAASSCTAAMLRGSRHRSLQS